MLPWSKISAFLAVPAAIVAIVGGGYAFTQNFVTKTDMKSGMDKVEIQLAGMLEDFRKDYKDERQQRQEHDIRNQHEHLKFQIEYYEDRLNQLIESGRNDKSAVREKSFYERQLERARERLLLYDDALLKLQSK